MKEYKNPILAFFCEHPVFVLRNYIETKSTPLAPQSSPSPATQVTPPPPSRPTPTPSQPTTVLFVGDSIANSLDSKVICEAAKVKMTKVKAYTSVRDEVTNNAKQAPKIPHQNFTDVCQKELGKTSLIL